jgi:osmotically-inducible protein OsmY
MHPNAKNIDADSLLARRVTNFLSLQHTPALRNLHVTAREGAVTLQGRVRSYYEKQLGQHSARRVAGVHQVIDEIEVAWPPFSPSFPPAASPRSPKSLARNVAASSRA